MRGEPQGLDRTELEISSSVARRSLYWLSTHFTFISIAGASTQQSECAQLSGCLSSMMKLKVHWLNGVLGNTTRRQHHAAVMHVQQEL